MGSLENGLPVKRDSSFQRLSSNRSDRNSFSQRPRSRFARFILFKKIDYFQWVCTVAVFFFFVVLFQMLLPGSITEKSGDLLRQSGQVVDGDLTLLKEMGVLDFGEDIKFEPSKILAKFEKDVREGNGSYGVQKGVRFGLRKPKLAMVFTDLLVDPQQIMMVTLAAAFREIGYEIEVHSIEDGPAHSVWRNLGVLVNISQSTEKKEIVVDWLNYDGVLVNSLDARRVISSLLQEPFKSVPLIWTMQDSSLATRLRQYLSNGQVEFVEDWKRVFARATVVVYPNHVLPILYSPCDTGNFFVIPGSPAEAWEVDHFIGSHQDSLRDKMNFSSDDFVIAVVGSPLLYGGMWLEHALVLQAMLPLLRGFPPYNYSTSNTKVIVISRDSTHNYSVAVEMIATKLKYPFGTVKHISIDEDVDGVLSMVDLVIYGSFYEEQSFPEILKRAMCLEKPIIAPDHALIKKYVDDRVNGYLYPKENIRALTQILLQVMGNEKLSPLARNVASIGKHTAKNIMVSDSIEGYSLLLENVLQFPSEVALPQAISVIPQNLKEEWQWHHFESISDQTYLDKIRKGYTYLDELEKQWNNSQGGSSSTVTTTEAFLYSIWEEEKFIQIINTRKRREDEELKDRTDQPRGSWDDVYRNAKKADRLKNDLHERDDGELERTGQPLTIYEPYLGEGAWPFLHHRSLYRGLGLSSKGRRSGADDVDAPSRLSLLNNPYYRDVLSEYGAFFAIANRVDRIHRNAWIGFQSWRATARKESLSKDAESALLNDIETRRHGDAHYFWVRMDKDHRNPSQQDFWSFCDAINAGNCRFAFSETLKKMYGIKHNLTSLPPMPKDGGTWSVMHSWALPTRSFMEFVMFSRMFVDSLDSQYYETHHQSGYCYLSLSKDKHCYSRVLELLVNVWVYHSGRRMIYINPDTGLMQEHHMLKSRRGQMWVKWFNNNLLKSMDEDLAEEADSDGPKKRWLWPSTGEVFWKGMYEKERSQRSREKEKRKQQSKDKIDRIRKRTHQKTIGRYMKPPPIKVDNPNTTVVDV